MPAPTMPVVSSAVTDEQPDTVGFPQYPYGSDPDDSFVSVPAGANLEFIHHRAEIALLRDLRRARFAAAW